ncbi:MAG TPA: hypothetical protein PLY76_03975 [Flavobacteriales bacterium]|nr:hypothetical protein [Flavobacteriales bacterium]HRP81035.1 hypothetical protein [Flavobacteriales bacterium]
MPAAPFRVEEVKDARNLRRYIHLPERLPGQRPNFVPPVWADEHAFHDPRRNAVLNDCDTVRFLAWQGKQCTGRIMGLVHRNHNRIHGERTARFYQLDTVDDPAVSAALIGAVEHWARSMGMQRIIGPFGLSDKDPQGAQVEGFEHPPVLATPANPAFLPKHIEALGYGKVSDALAYKTTVPREMPALYRRITDRLLCNGEYRVLPIASRKALRPWVVPVLRLVNESYKGLLGFVPMDEAAMNKLAAQYMPVLDPGLVKVVVDRNAQAAAFVVGMPDMGEGLRKARGRLFPFGFIHVLGAMKRSRQLNLLLGAVRPDLQGHGLTCLLANALLEEARRRGYAHFDSHLVLETNRLMRAELERLGGTVWKRYRVYGKDLWRSRAVR